MTTPVSFELAKLLKEKGFDIPCREGWVNYLASFTGEIRMPDDESNLVLDRLGNSHLIERPTIAEIIMWLYEKHRIWIYADSHEFGKWCYNYKYNRPHVLNPKVTENGQFGLNDYNSPTEAYEAAIEYILTKLI